MTRPLRILTAMLTCAVVLAGTAAAVAQTAGEWPQFQGGAAHAGTAAGPEPGYREAWTLEVSPGGPGDRFGLSAPVIVDGLVIAVGPEQVVAADVTTGEQVWTLDKELGPSVPGAAISLDGSPAFLFTEGWGDGPPDAPTASPTPTTSPTPTPSPTPADGGDGEAVASSLVAVSLENRDELWRAELPDVSRSGVTVTGAVAVVGTNDGSVTAVDLATGAPAWSVDVGQAIDVPIAADGDVVVASTRAPTNAGPAIVGLDVADGSERWRFAPSTLAPFTGPPTLAGGAVFVGFADRQVWALEAADGTERWSATVNGSAPLSPITATADAVYVVTLGSLGGSQVIAFDPATGARRWDHPLDTAVLRAPALALGDAIVTGGLDGSMVAFDAGSGDLVWRSVGTGPVRALAADGTTLVAVRAKPAGLQGFVNDPEASLVAIASPTSQQPGQLVAWWAAAAVIVGAAAFGLGTLLSGRAGPMTFPEATDDEIEDA